MSRRSFSLRVSGSVAPSAANALSRGDERRFFPTQENAKNGLDGASSQVIEQH